MLEKEIKAGEFRCRCLLRKGLSGEVIIAVIEFVADKDAFSFLALCWAIKSRQIKTKQEERTQNNVRLTSSFAIWKKRWVPPLYRFLY